MQIAFGFLTLQNSKLFYVGLVSQTIIEIKVLKLLTNVENQSLF
jgi:hypothetical protein